MGHKGTDGSSAIERCEKYLKIEGMSGENIDFGKKEPKMVLISLLINDGQKSKHFRKNIFQP